MTAFVLVLAAALLHASWNLLVKASGDRTGCWLGTGVLRGGRVLSVSGSGRRPVGCVALLRCLRWRYLFAGTASAGAYDLVLIAARSTPLGLVSAVRETAVVFGALGGWLILKEPLGVRRLRSATLIVSGLVLLAVAG